MTVKNFIMVQNLLARYQRIIPYLAYDDAEKAIDFLTSAFDFRE